MRERLYKFTNLDGTPCHGGTGAWPLPTRRDDGTWEPGAWREERGPLRLCAPGTLHLCRVQHLPKWAARALWEAEPGGPLWVSYNKVGLLRARLLRQLEGWNETAALLCAADFAERALVYAGVDDAPAWRAVHTARLYVLGDASRADVNAALGGLGRMEWRDDRAYDAAWWSGWGGATNGVEWMAVGHVAERAASLAAAVGGWRARAAERLWQGNRIIAYGEGRVDLDAIREAARGPARRAHGGGRMTTIDQDLLAKGREIVTGYYVWTSGYPGAEEDADALRAVLDALDERERLLEALDLIRWAEAQYAALEPVVGNIMPGGTYACYVGDDDDPYMGPGILGAIRAAHPTDRSESDG